MTPSPLAGLTTVLGAEEALYLQLRDALQEEHAMMATLDAEGLSAIALRKEELADEGRVIEDSRRALARELARELGLDDPEPRLSRLCEALGPEGAALREVHTRLVVLLGAVRELMDANQALAGDALSQVRGTLRLLGGLVHGEITYDPQALSESSAESPRLGVGQLIRRTA